MVKQCSIEGCASSSSARGWCHVHYKRWHRYGDPLWVRPARPTCKEDGCGRLRVGQGWCDTHYARFVRRPRSRAIRLAARSPAALAEIAGREAWKQADAEFRANRACAFCGKKLSEDRRLGAMFCDRRCKTQERSQSGAQREAADKYYYKNKYGLSQEEVQKMRTGGCGICGAKSGAGRHGQLNVDHDHATGRVRGVLCNSCNLGLGQFGDSKEVLVAAVQYLS